jgi:hypothetical protein
LHRSDALQDDGPEKAPNTPAPADTVNAAVKAPVRSMMKPVTTGATIPGS